MHLFPTPSLPYSSSGQMYFITGGLRVLSSNQTSGSNPLPGKQDFKILFTTEWSEEPVKQRQANKITSASFLHNKVMNTCAFMSSSVYKRYMCSRIKPSVFLTIRFMIHYCFNFLSDIYSSVNHQMNSFLCLCIRQ